jgi:hypothetical protein
VDIAAADAAEAEALVTLVCMLYHTADARAPLEGAEHGLLLQVGALGRGKGGRLGWLGVRTLGRASAALRPASLSRSPPLDAPPTPQVLRLADRLRAERCLAAAASALAAGADKLEWADLSAVFGLPPYCHERPEFAELLAAAGAALMRQVDDLDAFLLRRGHVAALAALPFAALTRLLGDDALRASEAAVFYTAMAWVHAQARRCLRCGSICNKDGADESAGSRDGTGGADGAGGDADGAAATPKHCRCAAAAAASSAPAPPLLPGAGAAQLEQLAGLIRLPHLTQLYLLSIAPGLAGLSGGAMGPRDAHAAAVFGAADPETRARMEEEEGMGVRPSWRLPRRPRSRVEEATLEWDVPVMELRRLFEGAEDNARLWAPLETPAVFQGLRWTLLLQATVRDGGGVVVGVFVSAAGPCKCNGAACGVVSATVELTVAGRVIGKHAMSLRLGMGRGWADGLGQGPQPAWSDAWWWRAAADAAGGRLPLRVTIRDVA